MHVTHILVTVRPTMLSVKGVTAQRMHDEVIAGLSHFEGAQLYLEVVFR